MSNRTAVASRQQSDFDASPCTPALEQLVIESLQALADATDGICTRAGILAVTAAIEDCRRSVLQAVHVEDQALASRR